MKTEKTNPRVQNLAVALYKFSSENKIALWRKIADELLKPTRQRRLVNVFSLELNAKDGEIIVVPGKVLGTGDLNRKLTVAAFDFSESAVEKIKSAKGSVMTIEELVQKNPKGTGVRVLC